MNFAQPSTDLAGRVARDSRENRVAFRPEDRDLIGRLPFASLRYFDAVARNVTGVHLAATEDVTGADLATTAEVTGAHLATTANVSTRWPVRAFELWGRTARMSSSERHIASCAVISLDYVIPSLVLARSSASCELTVSGADERFTDTVLQQPFTGQLDQLAAGEQLLFAERFVTLAVGPEASGGLRALAERCWSFVEAIPAGTLLAMPRCADLQLDPLHP